MKATTSASVPLRVRFLLVGLVSFAQFVNAQDAWQGGGADNNWMTPANWQSGQIPSPYDSLTFSAGGGVVNNNFPNGTAFDGLSFLGAPFTLTGNGILLSGNGAGNFYGVFSVASPQTITLNLSLDWGFYMFIGGGGAGQISLNGSVSTGTGGLAFFDGYESSTSLTTDGTGLIDGLGGQGLIFNGSATSPVPTGLASVSGGNIVPYAGYTAVASGAIPNNAADNLNLTASGSAATYSAAAGTTVNTITVAQTGNAGGTATSTLTLAGTLTLGQQGGVYLLGNTLGNKSCLSITGGTLTAGTSTNPATIVLAVNGNNANNQASVASTIVNNPSGGTVAVIKTGPGSLNYATTTNSSYSGGTFIDQGQLQWGQYQQVGTGPIYVSPNATAYYIQNSGNISNNLYLSTGYGAPSSAAVSQGGALIFAGSGTTTLSGTVNLLGAPVMTGPGVRFCNNYSSGNTVNFTGQITGTGTVDIFGAHSSYWQFSNPSNNWQGGMIVETKNNVNAYVRAGADNVIPHGANAGNLTLIDNGGSTIESYFDVDGHRVTINGLNSPNGSYNAVTWVGNIQGSGAGTLTLGDGNASGNFYGVVTNIPAAPFNLVKIGAGTQTLNGPTYHTGATTVSNGVLQLAGSSTLPKSPTINIAAPGVLDVSQGPGGTLTLGASQALNSIGTVNGSIVANGPVSPFMGTIGTLTASNGNVTLGGTSTFVWDINNASGTVGADPGWGLFSVPNGSLTINAGMTIDIVSLSNDVSGNAANFNPNVSQSWVIMTCSGGISAVPAQIVLNNSGFKNSIGSGSFTVSLQGGTNLVLNFTAVSAIATDLIDQTNNAGTTASFTVVANGAVSSPNFLWFDPSDNPLSNGETTSSGASVTITTNGAASTLQIAGVQDSDAGFYSVIVTNSTGVSGDSTASLTVIDAPIGVSVAQSGAIQDPNLAAYSGGGLVYLTANPSGGTLPLTYTWSLNGNVISGATSSVLGVELTGTNAGNYTVTIGNQAGTATSGTTSLGPVTTVPGQMVFEPFDSYAIQNFPPGAPVTWTGMSNLYNQITGEPVYWLQQGTSETMVIQPNGLDGGAENQFGGVYPWPGLAGNSENECYWNDASPNNHLRITTNGATLFAPGAYTNIYFSFVWSAVSLGNAGFNGNQDVVAGFSTSGGSTAMNYELVSQITSAGAGQYALGILKGNGQNGQTMNATNTTPITNVLLGPTLQVQVDYFVVGCYSVVSGGTNSDDTLSLWINPATNTFYAATPPAPNVGPSSFGVKNSVIEDFVLHSGTAPASHRITDLRIGTTWASVTPPSTPTFSFYNQIANNLGGTNVILAAQNAGDPVTSGSQWTFDNGSGPVTLSDTTLPDNAQISGSSTGTLTITGATANEEGIYTFTGSTTDPCPNDNSATLTGSASTAFPPPLSILPNAASVVISWPPWSGYSLEKTPGLSHPSWTIVGSANPAKVPTGNGTNFFQLVAPPSGH